jgi:hypothetical protein
MTALSVLSAPYPDLAGDVVEPSGLNFSPHRSDPGIDLEHGRDPLVKGRPVAWARPSLSKPGPYHEPVPTRLNFGTDEAPEWHVVPVGTEWYDPGDRLSSQTFALVEQDALPGRSLEFTPVKGFAKAIGYSDLEGRPSYHFAKADVLRWTVCARPVCEQAFQVQKSVAVPPSLGKILSDRRVNVGGRWEPLCGALLKALSPYAEPPPNRTTVRVEKAMDDEMDPMADALPDADTQTALEADTDTAPASNGVTAIYNHVQQLEDAADALEGDLASSDNPKLIAEVKAFLADLRKHTAKTKKLADKHDAKLQAALGTATDDEPEEFEAETEEVEDDDGEGADEFEEMDEEEVEKALARDASGILTNVRPVYKKALRGKRFNAQDIQKGQEPQDSPEDLAFLREQEAKFQRALKWTGAK